MRVLTLLVFAFCFTDVGRVRLGLGDWPFPGCGGGGVGLAGCVQGRGLGARAPRLPTFILLISFSNIV